MKVTNVEKKENSTVELTIQVEPDAFEAAVQKAYLKARKNIAVPGFRKGKAPRKIIEGMYGTAVFYEEAINDVYPAAYEAAVKEQNLEDMGHPVMDIVEVNKEKGLIFTALVSVRPEVTLKAYKGLTAPKAEVNVTDEDIENELQPYIRRATRLVSVDREAHMGDTAVIDFEGFDDGKPFEGGKGEDYSLEIGSGSFVPGFEDQLIGLKAGDEKDLDITFPEDYVPDLAGKSVVFKVKVKEVKEPQAPEVDDEFAKDVSEFETLADFKKDLGEKLQQRRTAEAQNDFESAVLDQLIDNLEADIPDGMVETQLDKIMDEYAMRMSGQGMSMDDYLKMMGMTPEMLRTSAKPSALRQVKTQLALEAVAAADTIVFDKTGTLTHACPRVAQVVPFGGKEEAEMLRLAACLEEHFPHSMANAVVEEAKRRGLRHEEYHSKVEYLVAHGIASTVDEERVLIGSAHFVFEDEGCVIPEGEQERFDALPPEYSHLYLAVGRQLAAVICISDPLREEAKEVLSALRALGIASTVMLTGDSYRTAAAIAAQVGVDDFRAGVLPADKAEYVARLRREGHTVLMVGDGINDSPALSEADAGIAISDGAAIAREIADITIAADSLWELVELRRIAMALMARIHSNYRFVIGFNGALIALGVAGVLPPATSATLHNLSTLGVSLRSMSRLTTQTQSTRGNNLQNG